MKHFLSIFTALCVVLSSVSAFATTVSKQDNTVNIEYTTSANTTTNMVVVEDGYTQSDLDHIVAIKESTSGSDGITDFTFNMADGVSGLYRAYIKPSNGNIEETVFWYGTDDDLLDVINSTTDKTELAKYLGDFTFEDATFLSLTDAKLKAWLETCILTNGKYASLDDVKSEYEKANAAYMVINCRFSSLKETLAKYADTLELTGTSAYKQYLTKANIGKFNESVATQLSKLTTDSTADVLKALNTAYTNYNKSTTTTGGGGGGGGSSSSSSSAGSASFATGTTTTKDLVIWLIGSFNLTNETNTINTIINLVK